MLEDKRPDRSSEGEATGPHCAVRRGPSPGSAPGRPRRASASSPVKWGRAAGRAGAVPRAAARGRPWPLRRPRAGIALDLLLFITPARPAAPVNTFLQRVIHRPADSWSRPALRTWGWAWRWASAWGWGSAGEGRRGSPRGQARRHQQWAWTGPPSLSPPHPASSPLGYPGRGDDSICHPTPNSLPLDFSPSLILFHLHPPPHPAPGRTSANEQKHTPPRG